MTDISEVAQFPVLDREAARTFLQCLDTDTDEFTFQTFTESEERRKVFEINPRTKRRVDPLARTLHGTLDQHWTTLVDLSRKGGGVFVTINRTNLVGRTNENVVEVRAHFADFDSAEPETVVSNLKRLGLTPHMIVESSLGKWHVYWRVYGASVSEFSATQTRLAAVLGSDLNVKDLPRVMRLPGFPHQKDGCAPSIVRIVGTYDGPNYANADFQAALAAAERHATSLANAQRSLAAELAAGLRSPPDMTQGYPDGHRTHELTKRAGWCLGPQRMSERVAVEACLVWNCHNTPPLPEEKVRATVASIAKSEARKREAEFHPIDTKLDGKHRPAQSGNDSALLATSAAWHENTFSAADLRTMTFEPVRYVLPRFIPEGMTLLVGRPKVGKSWWVLDLCLACAAGHPALGTLKAVEGDVLYLALEDGKRRLQHRLDKLLPTFSGEWPKRLTLVPMGGWHRADQGGLEDIGAWCKSVPKPVLVVVDTLERIRKPANGKSPLYSADYEAVTGLQKIALE